MGFACEILTLFPEMISGYAGQSILGKALERGHFKLDITDITLFSSSLPSSSVFFRAYAMEDGASSSLAGPRLLKSAVSHRFVALKRSLVSRAAFSGRLQPRAILDRSPRLWSLESNEDFVCSPLRNGWAREPARGTHRASR